MKLCYVDESGCTGSLPSPTSSIQPVFVLGGVIIPQQRLREATLGFLHLKARFFPALGAGTGHFLDRVKAEIKGSELRRMACGSSRRQRRHAAGFLDGVVALLERLDARLIGRIWIKGIGAPFAGPAVYTSSMQALCLYFQDHLGATDEQGVIIADSREKNKNAIVSHSIFTQKHALGGDRYERVVEMPTYGHSENHVGIQLADLLCSAFLFPMATSAYCVGHVKSVHVNPSYARLRTRYGPRLRLLQHRFRVGTRWTGGFVVSDAIAGRSGGALLA